MNKVISKLIFPGCFVVMFLLLGGVSWAQPDPGEAKEHFKNYNYRMAIPVYKRLLKYEPKNPEYLHRLGQCYLRSNIDKKAALQYLEKAVALPKCEDKATFDLGVAYTYHYKFDEAQRAFVAYKEKIGEGHKEAPTVDRAIENCQTARELMKFPLNVTFTNLGEAINSPEPDYQPYISKDGAVLVFTSRREENRGTGREFDGYFSSDIWIVHNKEDGWMSPVSLGGVNTSYDEQSVGISEDGSTVFVYVDQMGSDGHVYGDIYSVTKKGSKYGRKKALNENVNSKHFESAGVMSSDEQTLFFSSDRPGGYGGMDIWMSRKLPTGEWAPPQNCGPEINTPFDEDYPSLSPDNETMYFASEGHPGMGGFDLFKAIYYPELNTWSKPVNMGYPINTPEDNKTICFTYDQSVAYVSMKRDDSVGDLDIYKVTYNEVDVRPAVFRLNLATGDSLNPSLKEAFVGVYDEAGNEVGQYVPNPNTGQLVIVLMPGIYSLEIETNNYPLRKEQWKVTDFHLRQGEINKVIQMSQ